MDKVRLGPRTLLYPLPAVLVGIKVNADPEKIDPLLFIPGTRQYHRLGEVIAKAFHVGRE